MRLIDADKLGMHFADWVFGDSLKEVDVADVFKMLDDAPTVDAIPFSWLRVYANLIDYTTEDMVVKIHLANIVETIITDFQKEWAKAIARGRRRHVRGENE